MPELQNMPPPMGLAMHVSPVTAHSLDIAHNWMGIPSAVDGHVPVEHDVTGLIVAKLIDVRQQIWPPMQSVALMQVGAAASCGWAPLLLPLAPPLSSALPPLLELPLLELPLLPPSVLVLLLLLDPQAAAVATAHDAANKIIAFFM
jgi:hypothetical protein